MSMKAIASSLFILVLVGCAPTELPVSATVDTEKMGLINAAGSGSISGQAFARQVGGDTVTAAGETVSLMVETPYSTEVTDKMVGGFAPNSDVAVLQAYSRATTADRDGRFKFEQVSPGQYIVLTRVSWAAPGAGGMVPQGGFIKRSVTVENGRASELIMAR